ncbi:hypothetical protein K7640_17075 [Micromonospora sp. PLK6-60]|uniref:hypothetical protein n=1 Tax=Micromonospora sp. PLK6-60 TaxID=2873383 RepID=UPI001CA67AA2|nr:hypothetical protein [Micromonospora sp. PLK6-60]MBY8873550.1 hypothetical protein [Micromonospora sp. PLK6-60]
MDGADPQPGQPAAAPSDLVTVDLTEAERHLLARGLAEWGGPAHCTEALAVAMGFAGVADLHAQAGRLAASIRAEAPLSRHDWRRVLIATEVVFASDIFGSGHDWETTTGLTDEETIRLLRAVQRELARSANVHNL